MTSDPYKLEKVRVDMRKAHTHMLVRSLAARPHIGVFGIERE